MPRELRPELETLIASGHCNWHTAMDITLTSGTQLYFSSGEIYVNRFGVTRQYLAKLREVGQLDLSVDVEVDQIGFKVANVDMVIGQTLTGATRQLDGARGTRGVIFIDRNDTNFSAGQHILDQNFPGELVASEVSDETADFSMPSVIDSVIVSGRTIASEFQWREPVSNVPDSDPSDIPIIVPDRRGGGGRYGDDAPPGPRIVPRLPRTD